MIYREQILKNKTLVKGDLAKDCVLVDCIVSGAILDNCKIKKTEKKTEKKVKNG